MSLFEEIRDKDKEAYRKEPTPSLERTELTGVWHGRMGVKLGSLVMNPFPSTTSFMPYKILPCTILTLLTSAPHL